MEEISLQTCILKRWDGARVWYPNIVMLSAPVTNISRSGCKWESFTVSSFPGIIIYRALLNPTNYQHRVSESHCLLITIQLI